MVPQLGASRTKAGTVHAAIVSYYQSTAFDEGLAEGTRKSRRAILERFRSDHGDKRIAMLHTPALQAILNKRSAAAARNWKKALRGFLDHCLSLDMINRSARWHHTDEGAHKAAPAMDVGRYREIRAPPRPGNEGAAGAGTVLADQAGALRRREDGAPVHPQGW